MSNEDEQYNGWANRETWAFNLHWQNDEGLYRTVQEWGEGWLRHVNEDDERLGNYIVHQAQELWALEERTAQALQDGSESPMRMWERETGSVWRVDYEEVGAAVRADVSDRLSVQEREGVTVGFDELMTELGERDGNDEK